MWTRVARLLVRHPVRVLVGALALMAVLATGLVNLGFRTDQDTLVNADSSVYQDNVRYQQAFGGEQMLVLFTGDPVGLFSRANLPKIQQMESELRATPGVTSVIGPYTAMEYAKEQLGVAPDLVTNAALRAEDPAAYGARTAEEAQRMTAAGAASLDNPAFVRFLLFAADGNLRPAQKAQFPDTNHSLLVAQIAGNTSIEQQGQVSDAVKAVVAKYQFDGQQVLATGTPVLLNEINDYLQGGMATLGLIAVAVMIVVLSFAFRVRWRLLSLLVMAAGTAAALGLAVSADIDLSLVTISGLPIFIGLGVDFSIQMHNRYVEQRDNGDSPDEAARVAIERMAKPLVVAMVAGAFGFVALRQSPVPMIRDFGLLLCLGVVVLVIAAIVLPIPILMLVERHRPRDKVRKSEKPAILERGLGGVTSMRRAFVMVVFGFGLVVATAGFVVEGRMPIQTDDEKWVNQNGTAIHELRALRDATGFSTQLGVMIEADDVTRDDVVQWLYKFQQAELERHPGQILQAASMPGVAADVVGITPTGSDVRKLLNIAPKDIAVSLVTADHKMANLMFPIGNMSLGQRDELIKSVQADISGDLAPPPGVKVTQSGLAVIGIELVKGMEANRRTLTLAALAMVGLWLLLRAKFRPRGLLPLVPVAIAVGVATFTIYILGFELTPLTTVAAPLVIAVATEFTVLLEARYAEERANGCSPAEACRRLPLIGRAFVASGLTLVGGFAVMGASPMVLLRDFGIIVAIDVVIALASALVIMPPLLRWSDRHAVTVPDDVSALVTDHGLVPHG